MLSAACGLTAAELDAVAGLEQRVTAADGGRLKLEWGELRNRSGKQVDDLLWWDGDRLLGFCGIYAFGGPVELAGMVDPQARRQGIGTALLLAALALSAERGAGQVLLVTPRATPAGREFALRHGGALDHSEHHMVLGRTPDEPAKHEDVLIREAVGADVEMLRRILDGAFGPTTDDLPILPTGERERQLAVERQGVLIGCLRLNMSSATTTGIYGFAIQPELQGQGIGGAVLARVCRQLRAEGPDQVTLEVAVDNDHALGLYTSVGFEQRATEDYYRLPTGPPRAARGASASSLQLGRGW